MSAGEKVASVVGVVLHLVVGVFPYAASGLVVPTWGYLALYAFWLALAFVLVRLLRGPKRRPMLAPAVPVVAIVGWFTFVGLGEALLDWTA